MAGCHLTLESVSRNVADPHVMFVPLGEPASETNDVHLRAAWRRDDKRPALRTVMHELFSLGGNATPSPE